mmetsp:Transcript_8783/g.14824  ORF Transcript_8783/g.14824 Transcript_8783/m.14824 type:complete len:267 (+) Transcript_8783:931-1731(+)
MPRPAARITGRPLHPRTTLALVAVVPAAAFVKIVRLVAEHSGARVEHILIGVDERRDFISQLKCEELELGRLGALDDNGRGGLVPAGVQLGGKHHFGHDSMRFFRSQTKSRGDGRKRHRVVMGIRGDQVSAHPLDLQLASQEGARAFGIGEQAPHRHRHERGNGDVPLAREKLLGGTHHVVANVLGGSIEDLAFEVVQQTTKGLGDSGSASLGVERVVCEVRQLEEHRADQVDRLDKLEVDMHVVWHEPAAFRLLLLRVALVVTAA